MAETLTNFVVGIGYDYDDQGEKKLESSLGSLKSKALQLGAALAGAFGANALTFGFAEETDQIGKFSKSFNILPEDVRAFGNALRHEGGTLDEFLSSIQTLTAMQTELRTSGGAGFYQSLGMLGVAGGQIDAVKNARNIRDAYLQVADIIQSVPESRRIAVGEVFGLSPASVRLLEKGSNEVAQLAEEQKNIRLTTTEMTERAAKFNDEWQDFGSFIGGFGDTVSNEVLKPINSVLESTNKWLGANRELINSGIISYLNDFGSVIKGLEIPSSAAGFFAGAGVLGGIKLMAERLPIIGGTLGGIAGSLAKINALTGAFVAGSSFGEFLNKKLGEEGQRALGTTFAQVAAFLGNEKARAMLEQYSDDPNIAEFLSKRLGDEAAMLDKTQPGGPLSQVNKILSGETAPIPTRTPAQPQQVTPEGRSPAGQPIEIPRSGFDSPLMPPQSSTTTPMQGGVEKVEVTLNLDGQLLERRIIDVSERQYSASLQDLTSASA